MNLRELEINVVYTASSKPAGLYNETMPKKKKTKQINGAEDMAQQLSLKC